MNGSQLIRLTRSVKLNDYPFEFSLLSRRDSLIATMERVTCADWDQKRRFVIARDGCIFRGQVEVDGSIAERKLLFVLSPSEGTTAASSGVIQVVGEKSPFH